MESTMDFCKRNHETGLRSLTRVRWLLGTAVLAWGLQAALAQTLPDANFKVLRLESTVSITADLQMQTDTVVEREALTSQGAVAIGKYAQFYNKGLESLEVQSAFTLKADGRQVAVTAEHIQRQQGVAASGTGLSWPDAEVLQVTFPDVQPGDRTVLRLRQRQLQTALPGWLSQVQSITPRVSFDYVRFRVQAPSSLDLQVQTSGMTLQKKIRRWADRVGCVRPVSGGCNRRACGQYLAGVAACHAVQLQNAPAVDRGFWPRL